MKISNFDEKHLDELKEKELSKCKYKNRSKKINESFSFEDLLSIEQRKRILKMTSE